MKITIVVGGRWHAFDLARELEKAGHLHRLITNYPAWFVKQWGIPGKKVVSLPLTFWAVKLIYRLGGEALMMRCQWHVHQWFAKRAVEHLEGSELIHGWSQWSEPSLQWAKSRGIPTVLERSSAHILEQSALLREENRRLGIQWAPTHAEVERMELREYELCCRIAVPSFFVERSFIKHKIAAARLYRNSLGVDTKRFKSGDPPIEPSKSGLRVIYAGSLSVRKGIHCLIEGFEGARLENSSLTLAGGSCPEIDSFLANRTSKVVRLGHRPQNELAEHYARSHCFAMASVEDGFGMVLCQALACGLPLICTTNTGGEDLLMGGGDKPILGPMGIKEYPAGFVVPINSPAAISWCLRNMELSWIRRRREALRLSTKSMGWSDYGMRAIELYRELLK